MKKTIAALFNNPLLPTFPRAFDSDGAYCRQCPPMQKVFSSNKSTVLNPNYVRNLKL